VEFLANRLDSTSAMSNSDNTNPRRSRPKIGINDSARA
jgi:hypothetical protein